MIFFFEDFQILSLLPFSKKAQHYNHTIFNNAFYMEDFYPYSNRSKLKESWSTLRESWRPSSIRFLNVLTQSLITEESKHEMYITKDICMTTRTSNVRLLYVIFTSGVCGHNGLITSYHLQSNFGMGVFLYIPPIFWQQLF